MSKRDTVEVNGKTYEGSWVDYTPGIAAACNLLWGWTLMSAVNRTIFEPDTQACLARYDGPKGFGALLTEGDER